MSSRNHFHWQNTSVDCISVMWFLILNGPLDILNGLNFNAEGSLYLEYGPSRNGPNGKQPFIVLLRLGSILKCQLTRLEKAMWELQLGSVSLFGPKQ